MKNDREYEAEILRSFENGEWQPVKNLKKEMARYRHAAAETLLNGGLYISYLGLVLA